MGVYLGHGRDRTPEAIPSFGRLYSALVHAAATGVSSRQDADEEGISASARRSLQWLEQNPPIGMRLPLLQPGRRFSSVAYRKEGVFKTEGGDKNYKVTERTVGEGTAVSGPMSWIWQDTFPHEVGSALDKICADVGCLGEASSMVILELETGVEPTHLLTATRGFFTPGGTEIEVPAPGRLEQLELQHAIARPKKMPTASADRHSFSAMPSSESPVTAGLVKRRLVPLGHQSSSDVPWDRVIAVPIEHGPRVRAEDHVAFAVAMHRALISVIGPGAPASVTGRYDENVKPPPNRLAIHYLPEGAPTCEGLEHVAHALLLLPSDMSIPDMDVLAEALTRLRVVRSRMGKFVLASDVMFLDGARFWKDSRSGNPRVWQISPAAVPERWAVGRTQADVYRETIAWSVGNVLKGLPNLEIPDNATLRLEKLTELGLEIESAKPLATRHPAKYVHRTNRNLPVIPYVGRIHLGELLPSTAITAIGQSRHLGGGLLVPGESQEGSVCSDA